MRSPYRGSILSAIILAWIVCAAYVSPLSAQTSPPDPNIFHFSGAGKVCPRIVSLVEKVGGRVDWGVNNQIAYDRYDPDAKRFQTWVMGPDGSSPRCITGLNLTLSQDDVGNPAWHPSGNYLVVQAADIMPPAWAMDDADFYKRATSPGVGFNNDLWLISIDGSHAAALTHFDSGHGVSNPHFSHAGDQLLWSELVATKPQKWVMHVARFVVNSDGPHVTNIRTFDPLGNAFYETNDFSPDDKQILFSTTKAVGDDKHMSVARMNLATGKATLLIDADHEWNEHAHYSPDGSKIIWASSRNIEQSDERKITRNDFWIMNADGSGQRRLTFFNDPSAPEGRHAFSVSSDSSWSPDGKSFVAYVESRTKGEAIDDFTGSIYRITLP